MKMFLISDNDDTVTGLRLAGIEGINVRNEHDLKRAIDTAMADKEIAVLILTEKLSRMLPDHINEIKLSKSLPLLVEIPDRHGTTRNPNFITDSINDAIGLKLS